MPRAAQDTGVRADFFERAVADLEEQAAEGLTTHSGPEAVRHLMTRRS